MIRTLSGRPILDLTNIAQEANNLPTLLEEPFQDAAAVALACFVAVGRAWVLTRYPSPPSTLNKLCL